jgi:hypothetical protein
MQDESRGIALLTEFAKTRDPYYTYGTHRDAYYNTSTSQFQNEVWWQRRVELWGEGYGLQTLRRYGEKVSLGDNHLRSNKEVDPSAARKFTFELPNSELYYNPYIRTTDTENMHKK